jgi:hypothetical protein
MAVSLALTSQWAQAAPGGGGGSLKGWVKLTGTVTNIYTGAPLAGVPVTLEAGGTVINLVSDANGEFSDGKVPIGSYAVTASAANYTDYAQQVNLLKGKFTLNLAMTPVARVIVSASVSGDETPGGTVTAAGSYIIMDGSAYEESGWSQGAGGIPVTDIPAGDTSDIILGSADDYAAYLIDVLEEPPLDELPPDLVLQPINQIQKGLQDRNQVVAIPPAAHEHAAEPVALVYSVTTDSGTYTAEVEVHPELPWNVSTGVRTVPVMSTVLLYAKESASYSWSITERPAGSTAALNSPATQTPWFTPDQTGAYRLQETSSGADITVHAGRYHGVIDPVDTKNSVLYGDGRPVADASCTTCHTEGGAAPANFDTWRNTGHAEAFTQGITTNGHFGENCFACHALGYGIDGDIQPGGIDDAAGYDDFIADLHDAQHGGDISTLWVSLLTDQPAVARLSNIQCENCHGPQSNNGFAHGPYTKDPVTGDYYDGTPNGPRVNLASETCGSCHGEPARHGRFQQWQLSNHADYDLARQRGAGGFAPGNCGRCHSGNGFIAWSKIDFDPDTNVEVTWDEDTVVPQTCVACHNPHDTGTTSGSDGTNARVRVNADTGGTCGSPDCDTYQLAAGFMASNVGKGATCMTCHNSRAGVPRNDASWASLSDSQKTGAPHHGVQADLIMGQNQYFTGIPIPGAHSLIEDVCVTCHMNATQPPDLLSYNQSGTNHTFAADPGICVECHGLAGETLAESVDNEITGYLDTLEAELGAGWERLAQANYPITGDCQADGVSSFITDIQWSTHRGTKLHIEIDGVDCGGEIDPGDVSGNGTTLEDLALSANDGALYKAAWNWSLNDEDATINGCPSEGEPGYDPDCTPPHTRRGVHNHAFSQQGLLGAIAAVQAVAP